MHTRDAMPVEPLGDAVPFGPCHQAAVATARADDEGGTIRLRGAMHSDGRVGVLILASANGCVIRPK